MSDGCDYQGYDFGAHYLDSICVDGWLWDADSCDEPGGDLTSGGEIPCPQCSHDDWLAFIADEITEAGWVAGYDGRDITTCAHPRTGAAYHKAGDGEIFRYLWLTGYSAGKLERVVDDRTTNSEGE